MSATLVFCQGCFSTEARKVSRVWYSAGKELSKPSVARWLGANVGTSAGVYTTMARQTR
jgi:hypothetical protein